MFLLVREMMYDFIIYGIYTDVDKLKRNYELVIDNEDESYKKYIKVYKYPVDELVGQFECLGDLNWSISSGIKYIHMEEM